MSEILNKSANGFPDGEIGWFLDQFCDGARFLRRPDSAYTVHDLLSLVLQCHDPKLTSGSYPVPGNLVACPIGKLPEPLWRLAVEIAKRFRLEIGKFEGRSFLALLKAAYPPQEKLFRRVKGGRFRC